MNKKFCSMLGITKKAGKLLSGSFNVEKNIKKNLIYTVIIADDASTNTVEKFKKLCEIYKTSYIVYGSKNLLGKCIGKNETSVIGIMNNELAKVVINAAKEEKNGGGE